MLTSSPLGSGADNTISALNQQPTPSFRQHITLNNEDTAGEAESNGGDSKNSTTVAGNGNGGRSNTAVGSGGGGPVNQPTLFGSSIKAQNQWQRDEKDKFVRLLQQHGRNWQVIADELPRRTPQQCRNYFQNYKYKLQLGQYLPAHDEMNPNHPNH